MAVKKKKTRPATGGSTVSTIDTSLANVLQSTIAFNPSYPTAGFSNFDFKDLVFVDPVTHKESVLPSDYRESITDIIYQKNMTGVSTLTMQVTDPNRTLIKKLVKQGTEMVIRDGGKELTFAFSQLTKASDQIQMVFESITIYRLRNQWNATGTVTSKVGTGVTEFMRSLVDALNYKGSPYGTVHFVAPDYATIWNQLTNEVRGLAGKVGLTKAIGLGRGTTTDPFEDSWTCMSRLASSVGWRLWENDNTVYFGPDEYWLGLLNKDSTGLAVPPINLAMGTAGEKLPKLSEFGPDTMLIDYDWDVQKPFGQATVTAMLDKWQYDIGEIVEVQNLGAANGNWMVFSMQRDSFMPQASMVLQVPMPFAEVYDPTSLPLPGFPLKAKLT